MRAIVLTTINRTYANNGQHLEQTFRHHMSGELMKADNRPSHECGDWLDVQIKSARATICPGTDLEAYMAQDSAESYVYITKREIAYMMNLAEYMDFCREFATLTRESQKNGGGEKLRLKHETKKMLSWLEARVG